MQVIISQRGHALFHYQVIYKGRAIEEDVLFANEEKTLIIVKTRARMIATRLGCQLDWPPTIKRA